MVSVNTANSAATVVPTCCVVYVRYTHTQHIYFPAATPKPFQIDSTGSVLFTFRVLLITRDATRYLQHKVHLPESLPHAGTTCGKALQVQTLSRAKRHSPPLQVLRTVAARISRTQRLCLAHVRKYTQVDPG